jgi:hypothetical protein
MFEAQFKDTPLAVGILDPLLIIVSYIFPAKRQAKTAVWKKTPIFLYISILRYSV